MFSSQTLILAFCLYMSFLFLIALWAERSIKINRSLVENPVVYALSLSVFLTSWTIYGIVGMAARQGMMYISFYLGATLMVIFWWSVLRKMIRIKNRFKVTSLADLLSARYGKSQTVAVIASLIAIIGVIPYNALQLKSVILSSQVLTNHTSQELHGIFRTNDLILVFFIVIFTILFGLRKVDPTERHPGMTMAIAAEAVFKLAAFISVGVYVTFFLFDGFHDIFTRIANSSYSQLFLSQKPASSEFSMWVTMLVISMSAVVFLPRQFHMSVIENADENHLKAAMWIFPLYMFLMTLFVLPIAMGGLLSGFSLENADMFVLQFPVTYSNKFIAIAVYLGGFSAATGMIMICTIAVTIMASNHILVPILNLNKATRKALLYLREIRWFIVSIFLLLCYLFERYIGESYFLANMGIMSFAAVLQFAPSVLGGLYWKKGNRNGAIAGLVIGFSIWFYTLMLPSFVRSGWISSSFLNEGLFGIPLLKPEQLFGLVGFDRITHSVFWSLLLNIGAYIFLSLMTTERATEREIRNEIIDILGEETLSYEPEHIKSTVAIERKLRLIRKTINPYLIPGHLEKIIERCLKRLSLSKKGKITVIQYAEFCRELEKNLSGYLGVALSSKLMKSASLFNENEKNLLSQFYAKKLARLAIPPDEMAKKIFYYEELAKEREDHARELQEKIDSLNIEITERKKIMQALRSSEEKIRAIIQQSIDGIVLIRSDGIVLEWNPGMERITGISAEKTLNNYLWNFLSDILRLSNLKPDNVFLEKIKRTLSLYDNVGELNLPEYTGVFTLFQRDGARKRVEISIFPLKIGDTNNIGAIARDITELEKSYLALGRSEARMQLIVENSNDAICVLQDEKLVLYNRSFSELFGFSPEELDRSGVKIFREIIPELKEIQEGKSAESYTNLENKTVKGKTRKGKTLDLELTTYQIEWDEKAAIVFNIRDITERLELEQQINQLQKMEAIGRLAGGIAHDFNNILTSIIGLADLALSSIDKHHPIRDELNDIMKAGERASGLTRQLLVFSRKQKMKPTVVDPNQIIRELERVLITAIGEDVKLKLQLTPNIRTIYADIGQLEQILMNLVINARDAIKSQMPAEKRIVISTDEIVVDNEIKPLRPYIPDGSYLKLSVADNGCGMDEKTMKQIFEPFFTTKPKGLGTGLGLSTVYGIVKQNNAEIVVESKPGMGAVFTIFWPVCGEEPEKVDKAEEFFHEEKGKHSILVVEDNPDVLRFIERSLSVVGFRITTAKSGEEALKILENPDVHFDLLFTDVILPGMTGKELSDQVKEVRPGLKVLFGTGYPDEYLSKDGVIDYEIDLVYKPYSFRSIVAKIHQKLHES